MAKLIFNAADVRRVVEHSIGREQSPVPYSDPPEPTTTPSVLLVHDDGVYLMSGAKERDMEGLPGPGCFCAYAQGCNPRKDEDWWDNARALVGGDDFGEQLPWAESIKRLLDLGVPTITINININITGSLIALETR